MKLTIPTPDPVAPTAAYDSPRIMRLWNRRHGEGAERYLVERYGAPMPTPVAERAAMIDLLAATDPDRA